MPKPRLSAEQASARGSDEINRGRFADRQDAPRTTGNVGAPPKHLSAAEKKVWSELVQAIPAGVAGDADKFAVELATVLLHQFRTNPAVMQSSRLALLMQAMSRLGLDPQARTRLHVSQPKSQKSMDPLEKYMSALNAQTELVQ